MTEVQLNIAYRAILAGRHLPQVEIDQCVAAASRDTKEGGARWWQGVTAGVREWF
jgi:hypothetical protein